MSIERAAMKGKLAEARDTAKRMRLRIEGNCEAIRSKLNTALTPVDEIDVPMVSEQFDELVTAWGELQVALSSISRLERALA